MATAEQPLNVGLSASDRSTMLAGQWRRLTRAATAVAVLTSPALFLVLHEQQGWSTLWAIVATVGGVLGFRGLVDVVLRRLIPWPSLSGIEDQSAREDDVVARRRASFWRRLYRLLVVVALVTALVVGTGLWKPLSAFLASGQLLQYAFIFPIFFLMNFLIFFGPMVAMGISQIQGFEPGDAD